MAQDKGADEGTGDEGAGDEGAEESAEESAEEGAEDGGRTVLQAEGLHLSGLSTASSLGMAVYSARAF